MPASKSELHKQAVDPQLDLNKLRGLGPKRREALEAMGVSNQRELLLLFPRSYDDWSTLTPLSEVQEPGLYTFRAEIANRPQFSRRGKLSWLRLRLWDGVTSVQATYFNQPWLREKFQPGDSYIFHGKLDLSGPRKTTINPAFISTDLADQLGMLAIYPLKQGLTQKLLRAAVDQALAQGLASRFTDPLPAQARQDYGLSSLDYALHKIHQPQNPYELSLARKRLAFDELFLLRAAMQFFGQEDLTQLEAPALVTSDRIKAGMRDLRESLPFELTRSQVEAINDVLRDLRQSKPMNRLLQGDVGSGKTMVALFAAAYVGLAGGQSLLMAPTSILAEQHYATFQPYFQSIGLKVNLLLGSTKAADRRSLAEACQSGETSLLIGTHALLQEDLHFQNLVLAITDEQHRFGVKQRANLGSLKQTGGQVPHRLLMTATPIPRSFAMIFFHDLDMSIMRDMPSGRQEVITEIASSQDLPRVYARMRAELENGGQAYVICPLIEESEKTDWESAETTYRDLAERVFPDFRLALLHGRLKAEEKDTIMEAFVDKKIDILVSTTVVEVGVDNQEASIILIKSAERFGLAQLHQLRGRVGRGERQSYCFLHSDSDQDTAQERLQTLVQHTDGFALAEVDLKMRGPGDFLGTRQHGLPSFQLLNIYDDQTILREVNALIDQIDQWPESERSQELDLISCALSERYPHLERGLVL